MEGGIGGAVKVSIPGGTGGEGGSIPGGVGGTGGVRPGGAGGAGGSPGGVGGVFTSSFSSLIHIPPLWCGILSRRCWKRYNHFCEANCSVHRTGRVSEG